MQSYRMFKIVIALLVLLNVVVLAVLWSDRSAGGLRPGPHGHPEGQGPGEFLVRELQLNEQQQEAYERMRHKHHEAVLEIRRRTGSYRQHINDQLKAARPDSTRIRQWCDSIGYCQRDAELITFAHLHELRAICAPRQQARFDRVIREAIDMLVRGE